MDLEAVQSAIMSGTTGVILVVRSLLAHYAKDGKITEDDIDSAFAVSENN